LDFVREGDALVVTKLDRLARSVAHLLEVVSVLERKGVTLQILGMGVDTGTPNGRLMLNILGSVAQFEREIMLERQREGISRAKAEGRYRGRKPTAQVHRETVLRLRAEGTSANEIAKRLGIGRASVYRLLDAPSPLVGIASTAGTDEQ
jgi:DNA invertase Pin-like site-specific DNA recombinase